ncbi:MAG: hypothetical protein HYV63_11820 [Candidatus Schekmanbacteria bacterium]|nr:hypothetical protein [Candidatus Schekmanbacteria bacterium]
MDSTTAVGVTATTYKLNGQVRTYWVYDGVKTFSEENNWCSTLTCLVGVYNVTTGALVASMATTRDFSLTVPAAGTYLVLAGRISWEHVDCRTAMLG